MNQANIHLKILIFFLLAAVKHARYYAKLKSPFCTTEHGSALRCPAEPLHHCYPLTSPPKPVVLSSLLPRLKALVFLDYTHESHDIASVLNYYNVL